MLSSAHFHEFLTSACGYEIGEPILVGVSGGLDSVVLCDLLNKNNIPFAIAHVNFGLRGAASDADEMFVSELAKRMDVPFYLQRCTPETFEVSGENSIQVAARKIRYAFFELTCQQNGFQKVAIAHHKDDSIETALLNFARGTGITGLTGIHPRRGNIIRPLLFVSRAEILAYAQKNKLIWQNDESNETDKYSRNRFRHHLLPYLMQEIPQAYDGFEASFKRMNESETLIRATMEMWEMKCCTRSTNETQISLEELKSYLNAEIFLTFYLRRNGFKELQIESASQLISGQVGMQLISKTHRLIRDRSSIFLIDKQYTTSQFSHASISIEEENFTGEIPNNPWIALVDASKVMTPLAIRKWQAGDKMIPFGMNGHRNVSDILNEMKLPLHKKEIAPVVLSGNEIVWIPGYRIAEKFRVEPTTSNVLRLIFNNERDGE